MVATTKGGDEQPSKHAYFFPSRLPKALPISSAHFSPSTFFYVLSICSLLPSCSSGSHLVAWMLNGYPLSKLIIISSIAIFYHYEFSLIDKFNSYSLFFWAFSSSGLARARGEHITPWACYFFCFALSGIFSSPS